VQHFFHEGLYKTLKPCVGTAYHVMIPQVILFKHFLNPEDGTGRLSRNVGRELPLYAAWCSRGAQMSPFTSRL